MFCSVSFFLRTHLKIAALQGSFTASDAPAVVLHQNTTTSLHTPPCKGLFLCSAFIFNCQGVDASNFNFTGSPPVLWPEARGIGRVLKRVFLDFHSFGLLGSEDALSGVTTCGSSPPLERDVQTHFHCCSIQASAGLGQLFLPVTVGSWPSSSAGIRGGQ